MEDIFCPFLTQLPGALWASLSFLWSKSKADTLNAMNDIDLNLWGVRVISMGVCGWNRERVRGSAKRGKMISALQWGTKRGRKLQERPPSQCAWRIVKWLCYREQVNCVSPPCLLYFLLPPMIYRAILLPCQPTITCAVLLKATISLLLYLASFEVPKS